MQNPFRAYILPIVYQDAGALHALLGLSACHLQSSGRDAGQTNTTAALERKLAALQSLGTLLLQEEVRGLSEREEVIALVLVCLLVLHDICESGMSVHGAHLTGISLLCSRLVRRTGERSNLKKFLLAALSWLDILRGFSGAEKLAYSSEVRDHVLTGNDFSLETLVGCPVEIFYQIGEVLATAKDTMAGIRSSAEFWEVLESTERFLRGWDTDEARYPTHVQEWKLLAEAYRHACILRVLRFPDTMAIPCEDARIQKSVSAILDVCAEMKMGSTFYKRLLFPLFLAGADTSSSHQKRFVQICTDEIKRSTGFQHQAMTVLLDKVWAERIENTQGWVNVPWMEYTCSTQLDRQHDYPFF